jgi:hypothetical protein
MRDGGWHHRHRLLDDRRNSREERASPIRGTGESHIPRRLKVEDGAKESFNSWATVRDLGRGRKEKGDTAAMDVLHLASSAWVLPKPLSAPSQTKEEGIEVFFR